MIKRALFLLFMSLYSIESNAQAQRCKGVKQTIDKYMYTYETEFNETVVTPIFVIRQYCLNPDYLTDDFVLYFSIQADTIDSEKYSMIDSTGKMVQFAHSGLNIVFRDGSKLELKLQPVTHTWLNNSKEILQAECIVSNKNLDMFCQKEISHFVFENTFGRRLTASSSNQLMKAIRCISEVKPVK